VVLPGGEADEGSGTQPGALPRLTLAVLLVIAGVAVAGFLVFFGPGEKARRRVYDFAHTPMPVHLAAALGALSLPVPRWLVRWVRWSRLGGVERSFRAVQRGLRWLGAAPDPARTPAQAAAALTGLLPGSASEIRILLNEYQHTLFAMRPGDAHTARRAAETLRAAALRAAVRSRVEPLRRLFGKGKSK
jgi:hypothetical protein